MARCTARSPASNFACSTATAERGPDRAQRLGAVADGNSCIMSFEGGDQPRHGHRSELRQIARHDHGRCANGEGREDRRPVGLRRETRRRRPPCRVDVSPAGHHRPLRPASIRRRARTSATRRAIATPSTSISALSRPMRRLAPPQSTAPIGDVISRRRECRWGRAAAGTGRYVGLVVLADGRGHLLQTT